jgi:SAM-dependent methyltransferase
MTTRLEFVAYPPTSFPLRDLLVLERIPLSSRDRVCEVGVGSGGTTARLARLCSEVTGFEISEKTVDALHYLEDRHENLRFVVADITEDAALTRFAGRYTRLIACDTLEHVRDPAAFFRGAAKLLAPGGKLFVTFPNEPKDRMHGVTRFDAPAEIKAMLEAEGFTDCQIGAAKLTPLAENVATALGWKPLRLVRLALRRLSKPKTNGGGGQEPPQTFDETQFFKKMNTWRKLAPAVNFYWFGVLKMMAATGEAFRIDWGFREEPFEDCQVLVLATRR